MAALVPTVGGSRMPSFRTGPLWLAFLALLAVVGGHAGPAMAAERGLRSVTLEAGSAEVVRLREEISEVFVSNPAVADVQANTPNVLYFFGKKPGEATVYASTSEGKVVLALKVTVTHAMSRLNEALRSIDSSGMVTARSIPGGIVLEGAVSSPAAANDLSQLAANYLVDGSAEKVINRLVVTAPSQVNIQVRIAEVSRSVTRELGVNWESALEFGSGWGLAFGLGRDFIQGATGTYTRGVSANGQPLGGIALSHEWDDGNINGLIDLLANEGLVSIMAEPNLTALSGETASFLAGGEFPIPISQDNDSISIEFKEFGVSLAFTPTVLSGNRISMRIRPEVSEINAAASIRTEGGLTIPGLSTRRAETTVELGSGQSFAIAGLLQNNMNTAVQKTPGLGDLPILGPLFRSNQFQRSETELVIIATPYIVRPVSGKLMAPTDGLEAAGEMNTWLNQSLVRTGAAPGTPGPVGTQGNRLVGASGFMVE